MESACLTVEGLDVGKCPEQDRDASLQDFIRLFGLLNDTKTAMYRQKGIERKEFSFGMIWNLFGSAWPSFRNNPSLRGISQSTYQMLSNLSMPNPWLGREIEDEEWDGIDEFKRLYGFKPEALVDSYVYTVGQWHEGRAGYYSDNQDKYEWKEACFLPNVMYSNDLLEEEIYAHGLGDEFEETKHKFNGNRERAVAEVFHKSVMARHGGALEGYVKEIGEKICKANFYRFEKELSSSEQRRRGSLRKIYSLVGKDGEKQYISLDFLHGMFEFHDSKGEHLGEFRFTGMMNSGPSPDHNIKLLKRQ